MSAYYNEIDPCMASWLRSLIAAGYLPAGDVDERSIEDVAPDELRAYRQIHFFAGIGGWAYALRLAGWPNDQPVVTGSCPCQPYSQAGQGKGTADERHLWPAMFWHIQQLRPSVVFGEQVASKSALEWWDLVASDLEGADYACAAADLPASSVGAPHRRQRLFWMAHAQSQPGGQREGRHTAHQAKSVRRFRSDGLSQCGTARRMAHTQGEQRQRGRSSRNGRARSSDRSSLEYTNGQRLQEQWDGLSDVSTFAGAELPSNPWANVHWIDCLDGKKRAVEPSIRLLAHGVSGRVGRLRGYGNAIVPQLAAAFIQSYRR